MNVICVIANTGILKVRQACLILGRWRAGMIVEKCYLKVVNFFLLCYFFVKYSFCKYMNIAFKHCEMTGIYLLRIGGLP